MDVRNLQAFHKWKLCREEWHGFHLAILPNQVLMFVLVTLWLLWVYLFYFLAHPIQCWNRTSDVESETDENDICMSHKNRRRKEID